MFTLHWGEVEGTPEHVIVHSQSATVLLAKLTFSVYLMAYTRGWCLMLKPAPASHTDQFQSRNWNIEIYAVLYQLTFRPIFVRLKKSPLRPDKIDWTDNDWQHRAFYSEPSRATPEHPSYLSGVAGSSLLLWYSLQYMLWSFLCFNNLFSGLCYFLYCNSGVEYLILY